MTPANFDDMVAAMLRCEQMPGLSVYQHGQSVHRHFLDLMDYMNGTYQLPAGQWRLPEWLDEYKDWIISNLHDESIIHQYTLYHDCGKPFCRKVDEDGRVHFPDHAEISAATWASVGGDETAGRLIRDDMVIHTASAEVITGKCLVWSQKDAVTLLVAALAEIHSNARMFGGVDSTSFKIKFKQIERRGKQICKSLAAQSAAA